MGVKISTTGKLLDSFCCRHCGNLPIYQLNKQGKRLRQQMEQQLTRSQDLTLILSHKMTGMNEAN